MQRGVRSTWWSWLVLLWGCSEPALDVPHASRPELVVDWGESEGARVPLLLRGRIRSAPAVAEPWLITGEVSAFHERSLRRGELADSLRERAVPLRFWREGADLWLQPTRLLSPDTEYSLSLSGVGTLRRFQTDSGDRPSVRRLFPSAAPTRLSVLCNAPDAEELVSLTLEPGGVPLSVTAGAYGTPRERCVTLEARARLAAPGVLPPQLADVLADPQPFEPSQARPAAAPPVCSGRARLGSGCLEVLDDRLLVTVANESLWLLSRPQSVGVVVPAGVPTELVRGLSPASRVAIEGRVLARDGEVQPFQSTLTTLPPRRHLVLNEVLANPLGPEPAGEWIELVNDSAAATTLSGLWLEDAGGSVPLPAEPVAPGETLLLVPRGFRASGLDVPVPADARRVELTSLGARGLTNGGEALLLVGAEGVVSRFPLISAAEGGRSVARRAPGLADSAASSFGPHGEPGASPGAPNVFDP
jgi:hypothetical protein